MDFDRLDAELKKRHMSRRSLALAVGINPSTLGNAFARRSGLPSEKVFKIADYLGVDARLLAGTPLSFADKLKSARKMRGLTQEELAELAGISRNSLINYENNHTVPTIDVVQKFSDLLGVSARDLLDECEASVAEQAGESAEGERMMECIGDGKKCTLLEIHFVIYAILRIARLNMYLPGIKKEIVTAKDVLKEIHPQACDETIVDLPQLGLQVINDHLVTNTARMLIEAELISERFPYCYVLTMDGLTYFTDNEKMAEIRSLMKSQEL